MSDSKSSCKLDRCLISVSSEWRTSSNMYVFSRDSNIAILRLSQSKGSGGLELAQNSLPEPVGHISFQLHLQGHHVGSWKSAIVEYIKEISN